MKFEEITAYNTKLTSSRYYDCCVCDIRRLSLNRYMSIIVRMSTWRIRGDILNTTVEVLLPNFQENVQKHIREGLHRLALDRLSEGVDYLHFLTPDCSTIFLVQSEGTETITRYFANFVEDVVKYFKDFDMQEPEKDVK